MTPTGRSDGAIGAGERTGQGPGVHRFCGFRSRGLQGHAFGEERASACTRTIASTTGFSDGPRPLCRRWPTQPRRGRARAIAQNRARVPREPRAALTVASDPADQRATASIVPDDSDRLGIHGGCPRPQAGVSQYARVPGAGTDQSMAPVMLRASMRAAPESSPNARPTRAILTPSRDRKRSSVAWSNTSHCPGGPVRPLSGVSSSGRTYSLARAASTSALHGRRSRTRSVDRRTRRRTL
jgi:hypothetical protein